MDGFLIGLGVGMFLAIISAGFIWYSQRLPPISSVYMIQTGMFFKMMLGSVISLIIIKVFKHIDLWAYALTLGMFVCVGLPIMAIFMTRKK